MTAAVMSNEEGKFLCPHCDKTYTTKGWMTKHIKEKHQEPEDTSKKIDEEPKKNEETPEEEVESTQRTEDISKKTEDFEEIQVNFLNTVEMERIEMEIEEEHFIDAVETLEEAIGLDVDLTVNDSMVKYLENEENYTSDFGSTMELERNRSLMKKLEIELKVSKKTIKDIRKLYKEKDESLKACLIQMKKSEAVMLKLSKQIALQNEELAEAEETVEVIIKESNKELNSLQADIKELRKLLLTRKQSNQEEIKFACDKCDYTSKTAQGVKDHMNLTHGEGEIEVHRQEKPQELHKCTKCPTMFKVKEQLNNHMKIHEFLCFYQGCGAETETEQQMTIHIDEVHLLRESGSSKINKTSFNKTNKKNKECRYFKKGRCTKGNECDFEHVSYINAPIEKHMESRYKAQESKEKYQCHDCDYVTNNEDSLKKNETTKHQPEIVVKMPLCRFYLQGRCTKGDNCKFRHNGNQKLDSHKMKEHVVKCNRGESCYFKAQGKCFYFHPGVGVQQKRRDTGAPEEQSQAKEIQGKVTLYCKYQEACKKKDTCTFKHFQKGFVPKRKNTNL